MTLVLAGDGSTAEASSSTGAPASHSVGRRLIAPVLSVTFGTVLIGLHALFYGNWIVDDAAITFAYARSFSEGWGPVVQEGADPVEGFSSPLWMALLMVGRTIGLFDHGTLFGVPDYVLFPKALALLCCVGILGACYRAATRVSTRPWLPTMFVGIALAMIPSFVIWSFSGMENALYALIVVWLAVLLFHAVLDNRLHSPRTAMLAGACAALAALTRPEGLIYAGVYPLVVLSTITRSTVRTGVRSVLLSTAVFAVPVGGYFSWRYLTFGQLLSSPSIAKGQGLPTLADMANSGELIGYVGAPAVVLLVAVVTVVLAKAPWWRRGLLALLVPLALALLSYAILKSDWMDQYRFATSIWVLGALVGALAFPETLRWVGRRGRSVLVVALVVTLLPTAAISTASAREFRTGPDISTCYVADRFGRVFNGYADILGARQASLLLPDLGGSALTSRLELIDMAGLTNDRFAELARDGDRPGQQDHVYDEVKPDFIHIRQPWSNGTGISDDPRLLRDYHSIHFDTYQGAPHGDWVRKDIVPDQDTLEQLRSHAAATTTPIEKKAGTWPRRHCGSTLQPGQTTVEHP